MLLHINSTNVALIILKTFQIFSLHTVCLCKTDHNSRANLLQQTNELNNIKSTLFNEVLYASSFLGVVGWGCVLRVVVVIS